MQRTYAFKKVFTGVEWLTEHAVSIENGLIQEIVPLTEELRQQTDHQFTNQIAVPGFIDVQVYGAAGRLFSAYPEPATLGLMKSAFAAEGTVLFMPTVATNTLIVFKQCITAIKDYWQEGGKCVHGIHLEGPWLNVEKKGAHLIDHIHTPTIDEVKDILDFGRGVIKMITVAPEICDPRVLELIQSYDVSISAGHSNASYVQANEYFDLGISNVTHLYNAMSPLNHREPGLAGAVLDHQKVRASIVPDGIHVDFAAVRIAKKIMGNRLFAITDAVTETTIGPYQHHLSGNKYVSNGILSGSALSMHRAFRNLIEFAHISVEEAHRMCSLYPAEILGQDKRYGRIAKGFNAQLVILNEDLSLADLVNI